MVVCAPGFAGRIVAARSHIRLDVGLGQSSTSLSFSFLTCKTATVILSCHCVVNDGSADHYHPYFSYSRDLRDILQNTT